MNRSAQLTCLVATAIVSWLMSQPAHAGQPAPPVPGDIAVPDGNKAFLVGHAAGVQIYSCNGTSWSLLAPRADLYGDNGKLLGTHFAGPTWQANDGSYVVGRRDAGVTVDPTAIPWLRLSATATVGGPGGDRLVDTTYVQRIETTGGLPPAAADCNVSTAGTMVEVPYTADYVFWKATGN